MSKPLEGIRVLDLTTFVAAPVCCRLLADLGADVIKVERPGGDAWRDTGKSWNKRFNDDENPVFDIYNTGKKLIALDLKSEGGKQVFWKLLRQADVFVTNTRPAALKRLGFSYEDVKAECPSLIYAIVLGYGEEGPDAALPAYDTTAFWSRSGFLRDMSANSENYMPVMAPSSAGDTVTALTLLSEICAALFRRLRTGEGDCVRSALYHNGIFTMGTMQIVAQEPWGIKYPRTRVDYGAPGGCFQCADGEWLFSAVAYAKLYIPKLYQMIGRPELIDDERFATGEAREKNKAELYRVFADAIRQQPCAHWLQLARELDLPMVRMSHFSDIATDEQAWANGFIENVTFRTGTTAVMPTSIINMDSVGKLKTVPAPHVGADTEAVLRELGYSAGEIDEMEKAGAIRTRKE